MCGSGRDAARPALRRTRTRTPALSLRARRPRPCWQGGSRGSGWCADAEPLALRGPQGGTRHLPVVGPRRIHDARSNLYLGLLRRQLELPDGPPTFPALLTPVEISQELRGIESREIYIPHHPVAAVEAVPSPRACGVPAVVMHLLPESTLDLGAKHGARGPESPHGPRYTQEIPPRESARAFYQPNLRLPTRSVDTL